MRDAKERERLLLRVQEAAAMLGIGRTKAYELIGRGDLQVVHIDGAARVPLVAVHRYVERLVSPPSSYDAISASSEERLAATAALHQSPEGLTDGVDLQALHGVGRGSL